MARTNKIGIDYFSFDVDFFTNDKIQLIESEFGMKGGYIAIRLLCKIYKEGYFYKWGADECLLFTRALGVEGVSKGIVDEIVSGLVRRCFFDKRCFDSFGILTSKGIQKRYFEATRRYKSVDAISEFLLIDVSEFKNVNIKSINVDINSKNVGINPQKKRKEKKGNNNPPISPPLKGDVIEVQKTWRDDFQIYLSELTEVYTSLLNNPEFLAERQRYHPNLDIRLTMEKAYKDYWSREEAWKKRKRSKTKELDWKATFRKSLDQKFNHVYLQRGEKNETPEYVHYV